MESTGFASQIQISASTYEELKSFGFRFEKQAPKAVKGKGQQVTYLLKQRARRNSTGLGEYEEKLKSTRRSIVMDESKISGGMAIANQGSQYAL